LTWTIDQKNQVLRVTASDSALVPTVLQLEGRETSTGHRTIESGTGMTLNYDVSGTFTGGQSGGTSSVGLRGFAPWGIISSDWLGYAGSTSGSSGGTKAIRLDSA
jgi:outer membrane usher protein